MATTAVRVTAPNGDAYVLCGSNTDDLPSLLSAGAASWLSLSAHEPAVSRAAIEAAGMQFYETSAKDGTCVRESFHTLARDVVAIAADGLKARARHDRAGRDESIHLAPLQAIASGGPTQAQHWLSRFNGAWNGDVTRIFEESAI